MPDVSTHVTLPADTNQALGIAHYALNFMWAKPSVQTGGAEIDRSVLDRTELFFADACLCGVSALALGTNAPNLLRAEALTYPAPVVGFGSFGVGKAKRAGATVFGSSQPLMPEKAIVANASAVREWDSNGTNFGFNPALGHTAGEFGHNDFYAVPIAAAQLMGMNGAFALRGMVLLDEIRGRLAEVFSLKSYKIDHVVHGAIASAATFGAMLKATPEQIESAIGMVVAHSIPFRAIRAGKQLSDSKGASAAISTEAAILAMRRSMAGFLGPRDIFRNPEAIFRLFEGPGQMFQKVGAASANTAKRDASPFELVLGRAGSDFAVMGMHFKLGLYEHQSAGALQGLIDLIAANPRLLEDREGSRIRSIVVTAYEPAFGIIGDPAKRDPKTRQSADHSMLYLLCTKLRKALEIGPSAAGPGKGSANWKGGTDAWKRLMMMPHDFGPEAITHPLTRRLMDKMTFEHGGEEYDRRYPDGIPTSIRITDDTGATHDSGLVMYPAGHARNTTADLTGILEHKFDLLARLTLAGTLDAADRRQARALADRFTAVGKCSADEVWSINDFTLPLHGKFD
ncbi:MAG: MmgE/PrpD family protein [Phycisphaeraceae bacterium]|nr:MmgE/PrpD family protein [Phycisphaeraceae bacterium]